MRKTICCIGLFAVFAVEGAFAQAGLKDMPAGKWWTKRPIIKELNLSLVQQSKIEALWAQRTKSLMGQQEALRTRQQDLAELLARDAIDETAALRLFDEVQQIRQTLERNTFLMRIQIKNLLSPGQQQKIESIAERLRQAKGKGDEVPAPANQNLPVKKRASH
jgi:Spy/CpxP family protein refolding chaperone